jgi:hypothetical protein
VVEGGTAVKADLGSFSLAGKTGTARFTVNGRYVAGHIPTFVGLFPGDHPQFVILVKIDNPRGTYVGGLTAAPVTKAVLEAALASRNAALDRRTLARSKTVQPLDSAGTVARHAAARQVARDSTGVARGDSLRAAAALADDDSASTTPIVTLLPIPARSAPRPLAPRPVPDVRGLTLRAAVLALHSAGFRVELGDGAPGVTVPAAGVVAPPGTLVRLGGRP